MKRKHLHTFLIMCIALLPSVTVKAGDNKWTLNANQTEWLYTYTTKLHPTTFSSNGYTYNGYAQGKITLLVPQHTRDQPHRKRTVGRFRYAHRNSRR